MVAGKHEADEYQGVLRAAQIITIGLATGVAVFLLVVVIVLRARVQPFDWGAVISMVMAGLAIALLPIRLLVTGSIVQSGVRNIAAGQKDSPGLPHAASDERKLLPIYVTKTIVGAAILEGGAFANVVAFMVEGQSYSLALATLLLAGILLSFPTRRGLAEWLEAHVRRVTESRLLQR